jgi:DNA-binding GntR family transcriptional regulator
VTGTGGQTAELARAGRDGSAGPAIAGTDAPVTGKSAMVVGLLRQLVAAAGAGARIPSERDLARDWGVARMTVRNAIEILINAGQLERRPGAGTFVVEPPYAKTLGLSSFTDDMRSRGRQPSNRLLEFSVQRAGADTSVRLGVDEDEPVYRFTRLRLADGQPIAVETNWIPVESVPDLDEAALEGSLFALLNERYGITPGEATSTIDAVLPDAATAAALGIGEHAPCLRIRMEYLDQRRRPLMAATDYYAGSRYQLHVTLSANAFAPSGPGGSLG